jgi:glycerol uptake facilitator-like aquaporin
MKSTLLGEFFGTFFLVMIVIGSGIMGENLSQGNEGLALLANSLATGFGLFVLIQVIGAFSEAHFNPVVSLIEYFFKKISFTKFLIMCSAQIVGAFLGVLLTHRIYDLSLFQISSKVRYGSNLWISEFIATFGLISIIYLIQKKNIAHASFLIASYIVSAYWFTSSTSFANPAVTVARMFTNTFGGIAPSCSPWFILSQIMGAVGAYLFLHRFLRFSHGS